ncbi:hypothetical protein CVO96_11360 [Deinococcus koreensis]|uniref:Uncharacterized protein n=1 Tax=Deinococcus koreensis TaxID=2054903 RepID=A0A2K3UZE7_9DEIO|nr:hypothetical protein CVO96_11360 [Deinococcus koreensis]
MICPGIRPATSAAVGGGVGLGGGVGVGWGAGVGVGWGWGAGGVPPPHAASSAVRPVRSGSVSRVTVGREAMRSA